MLEKWGATNVTVMNKDFTDLDPKEYKDVEYILVDPSCSGSGKLVRKLYFIFPMSYSLDGMQSY